MDFNVIRRLLSVPREPRTTASIIGWWELRRIPYNLIVAGTGILALRLFYFFVDYEPKQLPEGEDEVDSYVVGAAILYSAIGANICYTGGWVVELVVRSTKWAKTAQMGPRLFVAGLLFSMLVVGFPAIFHGIIYLVGLIRHFREVKN